MENKKQHPAGKIDPGISIVLDRLKESSIPDIDPYSAEGPDDAPLEEEPLNGADEGADKGSDEGAGQKEGAKKGAGKGGQPRGRKVVGGNQGVVYDALRVPEKVKAEIDVLYMCHCIASDYKGTKADFIHDMIRRGIEAEAPKTWALFEKFSKKKR